MKFLSKPNELIGAIDQIEVSRTAKHLLDYLLQYAQEKIKFHKDPENLPTRFEVDVQKINGLADIHAKNYPRLKKTLQALMQPVILRDDPKNFTALVPITKIDIDVDKGLYKFDLQSDIVDLLMRCDYFTKLELQEFNLLQGKHAHTICQILKRYERPNQTINQTPKISITEFRKITHTTSKAYDNFTNLRLRVLNVAIQEISAMTDYSVTFEEFTERTKRRPKVAFIQFTFSRKSKSIGTTAELTHIEQIHARYEELAEAYVKQGFCATKAEFYRATYICDYGVPNAKGEYRGGLKGYYDAKMEAYGTGKVAPLKMLLKDIASGQKRGRLKEQLDRYNGYIDFQPWQFRINAQKVQDEQGFLEQILINKERNNDLAELDGGWEKWL